MTRVDWLEFSVKVLIREEPKEALRRSYDAAQERAESGQSAIMSVGHHRYCVQPYGAKVGTDYFKYRLIGDFCELLVSTKCVNNDGLYPCRVVCRGAGFALSGSDNLKPYAVALEALSDLGHFEGEKLSRVDEAFDFYGEESAAVMRGIGAKHYATRAKRSGYWSSNGISHYFGKSPLMLRVYDKRAETRTEGDEWTRAEWQVSREILRELGATTVSDYLRHRSAIVAYLVRWFRLTDGAPDQHDSQRTPTHPVWQQISDDLAASRLAVRSDDSTHLAKAAVGCFLTYLGKTGGVSSVQEAVSRFGQLLSHHLAGDDITETVTRRGLS